MKTTRLAPVVVLMCLLAGLSTHAGAASLPLSARLATSRSWLAIGDSISSGFGIPALSRVDSAWGVNCRRASGDASTGPNSPVAWPVEAYRQLRQTGAFARQQFTACSGAITDDWPKQLAEGYRQAGVPLRSAITGAASPGRRDVLTAELYGLAASGKQWDLISLSFGANNTRIGDLAQRCLAVGTEAEPQAWISPNWGVCAESRQAMTRQIDILTGRPGATGKLANGRVTLWSTVASRGTDPEPLYMALGRFVRPGGRVLVLGYPQAVEESSRSFVALNWPVSSELVDEVGNCEGIMSQDVTELRNHFTRLNTGIRSAVEKANEYWRDQRVTFVFVDANERVFESPQGRHGLCSADPWINAPGAASGRLHPDANGHRAIAVEVVRALTNG